MTFSADDQDVDSASLRAEIRWMKSHYDAALAALREQNKALRVGGHLGDPSESLDDLDELTHLRSEVERMRAGERRYLDRIEELKTALGALKHGPESRF